MERRRKTLLLSILTLCVCTALVVGGTFALFTDEVIVNNHLQAGNLTVGLYRTAYTENTLNADGYLKETVVLAQDNELIVEEGNVKSDMDLTDEDTEWLFSINNVVPQSYYQADLDVVNEGSVAFDYGMRIVMTSGAETALADQIEITVTYKYDGKVQTKSFKLNEYATNDINLGILTTEQSGRFTVKAEFVDHGSEPDNANNAAQNQTVEFYVQVFATQRVSAPVVE